MPPKTIATGVCLCYYTVHSRLFSERGLYFIGRMKPKRCVKRLR
jgi:hypothetical protein